MLAAVSIAVASALAFGNNLGGKLVLDDQVILARNEHIRSLRNIPKLFLMNWWGMAPADAGGSVYRPLTATSFALDVFVMGGYQEDRLEEDPTCGGLDIRTLHIASILYHVITSVLVYGVILRLLGNPLWAWLGATLFAVHPVHVEAVSSHVGRAEVLAGLFFFAGTLAFLHGCRKRDHLGWSAASAGLWLAGLLSKEMAASLPVVLLLIELLEGRHRPLRRWLVLYSPFVAAAVIYAGLRVAALGLRVMAPYEALPASVVPYGQRVMTMTHAFAFCWSLILAPLRLSADHSGFPVSRSAESLAFQLSLLVHIAFAWAALWALQARRRVARRELSAVALGVIGFYLISAPVANLVVNTGVILSERAMYIPSFGPILAVVALAQLFASRVQRHPVRYVPSILCGALVVAGIAGCRVNNERWRDERSLFTAAIAHPHCGHIGLGGMARVHLMKRDYEAALVYAERAVAMRRTASNAGFQARALMALERYEEAIEPLTFLVRNGFGGSASVRRLARCYREVGREAEAQALESR